MLKKLVKNNRHKLTPIPDFFDLSHRKIIKVLHKTIDGNPVSQSIIKKQTKLHDQTIADVIFDLRHWGFMDKEDYFMEQHHFEKLKPYLEKNKDEDDKFYTSTGLLNIILIIILTFALVGMFAFVPDRPNVASMVVYMGNNSPFNYSEAIPVLTAIPSEMPAPTTTSASSTWVWIIVMIVVILLIWYFASRKR